jgi:methionyl-tRNA formyltransferase
LPSLNALIASNHEVVAVLTRPDAPVGRGRIMLPSPVKVIAEAHQIPVITDTPRGPEFCALLKNMQLDACAVVAYGHILPAEVLAIPRLGWVNLHFSVLPAWRGAAPVQRAIMAGDEVSGATTFILDEGMDTGKILGTLTETVQPADTSGELLERLATAGPQLLVDSLDALSNGTARPQTQSPAGITHAAKVTKDDARVDWKAPAHSIDRRIRGCTPAPGAWTTIGEDRYTLGPVTVTTVVDLDPGQIQQGRRAILVGTGTYAVSLGTVKPPGKKPMPATDWARGARLPMNAVFA